MLTGASPSNPVPLPHEMTWRKNKKVHSPGVSIIRSGNNTICLLLLFRLFCRIDSSVYNHRLQSLFPLRSTVHATALILQNSFSVKSVTFRSNAALHQKVKTRVAFTKQPLGACLAAGSPQECAPWKLQWVFWHLLVNISFLTSMCFFPLSVLFSFLFSFLVTAVFNVCEVYSILSGHSVTPDGLIKNNKRPQKSL